MVKAFHSRGRIFAAPRARDCLPTQRTQVRQHNRQPRPFHLRQLVVSDFSSTADLIERVRILHFGTRDVFDPENI
jgi:hypothetical protein